MSKQQVFRSRRGASFVEYALLAGLAAAAVAAAVIFFEDDLKGLFPSGADRQTASETAETPPAP